MTLCIWLWGLGWLYICSLECDITGLHGNQTLLVTASYVDQTMFDLSTRAIIGSPNRENLISLGLCWLKNRPFVPASLRLIAMVTQLHDVTKHAQHWYVYHKLVTVMNIFGSAIFFYIESTYR